MIDINSYEFQERISIKLDSRIPLKEAIEQTKREVKPIPECILRIEALRKDQLNKRKSKEVEHKALLAIKPYKHYEYQ